MSTIGEIVWGVVLAFGIGIAFALILAVLLPPALYYLERSGPPSFDYPPFTWINRWVDYWVEKSVKEERR